jgi:hypothetical protein
LLAYLQASNNASLTVMTYALQVVSGVPVTNVIVCTAVTPGTGGNAYTLTNGTSSTHVAVSGATLTGGVASGATCMTLSGKYSGILGNKIQFSIQNGTMANTYMGVVVFPGMVPEQFNNVPGPTPATGTLLMTAVPTNNDTVAIAGATITFVNSLTSGLQCLIGSTVAATMINLQTLLAGALATSQPAALTASQWAAATASNLVQVTTVINAAQNTITISANQTYSTGLYAGSAGNALALAASNTASVTKSGTTLTGGVGTWNTFWTNLVNVINSGNAYHGPSSYTVASVGTGASPPILSTAVTLSGGTDGTGGVTDATLMGQDVVPRKGMYALRSLGVDCFTLCDLSTVANYAAIASFAIQETCFAIFGSPSGDTIANCLATRINAGIDTPWFKLILGDWPTFYDSYNGVSRLINPSAFGIGIYGNLSPQQSALNKPLQGISATQRSTLGQTYSDTELSQINLGGIDVILPPSTSPGGYYFSFATGRNCSSNTAANGDEYTRMTNFLIRASQTKAAGSFVGQLQSIQPNDQTRANAKALFDGFSAQLASNQTGLGINGQGMIDTPWSVVCDLTNNPPNLQALGYLFLYWQVRYLNVIRYFVVKFQGGGNVTVSVQSTQPSPSQYSAGINTTTYV